LGEHLRSLKGRPATSAIPHGESLAKMRCIMTRRRTLPGDHGEISQSGSTPGAQPSVRAFPTSTARWAVALALLLMVVLAPSIARAGEDTMFDRALALGPVLGPIVASG